MPDFDADVRYLLFQVRNPDDPMRHQEVRCFARALNCQLRQIEVLDLLSGPPTRGHLKEVDVVLMGGSGEYSVAAGGDWLPPILEGLQQIYDIGKPAFASCWGFQAMAKALGGEVITDQVRAEVGCYAIRLSDEGLRDPVIGPLGPTFLAAEGHQDIVTKLPPEAVLLASTTGVAHQAFTFPDKPIYCTQFHPELDRAALIERVEVYPEYVERVLGVTLEEFAAGCQETPVAGRILRRFLNHLMSDNKLMPSAKLRDA